MPHQEAFVLIVLYDMFFAFQDAEKVYKKKQRGQMTIDWRKFAIGYRKSKKWWKIKAWGREKVWNSCVQTLTRRLLSGNTVKSALGPLGNLYVLITFNAFYTYT